MSNLSRSAKDRRLKRIVAGMRSIEFKASFVADSRHNPNRIDVRHPIAAADGTHLLIATIRLEPVPMITYCIPAYLPGVERALSKSLVEP